MKLRLRDIDGNLLLNLRYNMEPNTKCCFGGCITSALRWGLLHHALAIRISLFFALSRSLWLLSLSVTSALTPWSAIQALSNPYSTYFGPIRGIPSSDVHARNAKFSVSLYLYVVLCFRQIPHSRSLYIASRYCLSLSLYPSYSWRKSPFGFRIRLSNRLSEPTIELAKLIYWFPVLPDREFRRKFSFSRKRHWELFTKYQRFQMKMNTWSEWCSHYDLYFMSNFVSKITTITREASKGMTFLLQTTQLWQCSPRMDINLRKRYV